MRQETKEWEVGDKKSGWRAVLKGDPEQLHMLAESFTNEPVIEKNDAGQFILHSACFGGIPDGRDVRTLAEELIGAVSSLARLQFGGSGISIERIEHDGDVFVSPESASIRMSGVPPTIVIRRPDGSIESIGRPADHIEKCLAIVCENEPMLDALRQLNTGDLGFVALYRVYEIVEEAIGGRSPLVNSGWISNAQVGLFKRTANSKAVLGDAARHGSDKESPPESPMSLSEARKLITGVVMSWIRTSVDE